MTHHASVEIQLHQDIKWIHHPQVFSSLYAIPLSFNYLFTLSRTTTALYSLTVQYFAFFKKKQKWNKTVKEISPGCSLEELIWSWNSNTLYTWCEELTHLKRSWCWERLRAGGEGDNRGWESQMASLTQWTWVWVNSGSWWWTGRHGVVWFMRSQRVGYDWVTELNWTEILY